MTENPSEKVAGEGHTEVEKSILDYLGRHQQAADTLRGIVNWWLPLQRYESDCQRIEHVLEAMVARGKLCRNQLPGGDVLYALCKDTK